MDVAAVLDPSLNGLNTSKKQVGFLKRLKNIEDKTDRQLEENIDSQLDIKSISYTVRQELSQEAENIFEKLDNQENLIDYKNLILQGVIKNIMILPILVL